MLLSSLLLPTSGIKNVLDKIDSIIWGLLLLILLMGTGIYITIHLKQI